MSKPFTAKSMMKDSRFSDYFKTCDEKKLLDIEARVEQLIRDEHEFCVPISRPHLCNLFSALAFTALISPRALTRRPRSKKSSA